MNNVLTRGQFRKPSITSKILLTQSELPTSTKNQPTFMRPPSSITHFSLTKFKVMLKEDQSPKNLERSEVIKNFFAAKPKFCVPHKKDQPLFLRKKLDLECALSAKKVSSLENHLTRVSCLSPMLMKNYLGIVKRLEAIKLQSMRDTIKAENSHRIQLKLAKIIKNKEITSYLKQRAPKQTETLDSFKEKMLKMYELMNDPKVWKWTVE